MKVVNGYLIGQRGTAKKGIYMVKHGNGHNGRLHIHKKCALNVPGKLIGRRYRIKIEEVL